jgi:tetratricopeptide (TPR) repeat protein
VRWSSIVGILKGLCQDKELLVEVPSLRDVITHEILSWLSRRLDSTDVSQEIEGAFSLDQWIAYTAHIPKDHCLRYHLNLALAIAFLRESGRQGAGLCAFEIESVWALVRGILIETPIVKTIFRSVAGCLVVPLWSIVEDNKLQELMQLRVWLPDGARGNDGIPIYSNHLSAQKFIIFGYVRESQYEVRQTDSIVATHAKYELNWNRTYGKGMDTSDQTDQKTAEIVKAEEFVQASKTRSQTHSPYKAYNIDAGVFHESRVKPDDLHADLFFLDAQRGVTPGPYILAPTEGLECYQDGDPGDTMPAELVVSIEAFRNWERLYQNGLAHTRKAELEEALLAHRNALEICDGNANFPEDSRYRYMVLVELGYVYRMLGRYLKASECLEEAVRNMPRNESRLKACGELAVVYRQLSRLDDSKRACEEQYETAIQMGSEREISRAIGNLGMVNYQLFLLNKDQQYLSLAKDQLEERVNRCRRVRSATTSVLNAQERHAAVQTAIAHEAIAFARLSLCYTAQEDTKKAIEAASECQKLSLQSGDPSKLAFSRLFLGRALLLNGQKDDALSQFNPSDGNTPVAVLSKEPSEEHRGYIREMINAGADLTLRDVYGYSALDYAVYGGDETTQHVILEGLRRSLKPDEVDAHHLESMLRKGYRELFQDRLRPVLSHPDKLSSIKRLRQVYAATLAMDKEKAHQFDTFKYVRYSDFAGFGRLPKSTDNLTRCFEVGSHASCFVIFISYTWAKKSEGGFSPDDLQNTRYHLMIRAVESFLAIHSSIDPATVCIWIVCNFSSFDPHMIA